MVYKCEVVLLAVVVLQSSGSSTKKTGFFLSPFTDTVVTLGSLYALCSNALLTCKVKPKPKVECGRFTYLYQYPFQQDNDS